MAKREKKEQVIVDIRSPPAECIALVVSLTTPTDACRFASLSTTFYNAANSNLAWHRFLPSDYLQILLRSDGGQLLLDTLSNKDLFMHLANTSLLIDGGLMVTSEVWGLYNEPTKVAVETNTAYTGDEVVTLTEKAYLDPRRGGIFEQVFESNEYLDEEAEDNVKVPNKRRDGWVEVEIGEFFTAEEDQELKFSVKEVKAEITKGGLVVEGIEIRPIH